MNKVNLTIENKINNKTIEDDIGLNQEIKREIMSEKELTAQEILEKINSKNKKSIPLIEKEPVSFKFGIIGMGHAGSKLGEVFYNLGYDVIAMNTATQDLTNINIPEKNKLFLDVGIQGAAKDLVRGKDAAEHYRNEILGMIQNNLSDSQVIILCSSLSGGSGAGSLPLLIDVLQGVGKPIVMLAVLPMSSEDVKAKSNVLETLSKLSEYVKNGKIHNLICVDNARIEAIYEGVDQMSFYRVANMAIIEPLDVFNKFSMKPSDVKPLDSAEFATILLNGEGLSIYGQINVDNYEEDTAIAEAVMNSLEGNLLASGFNLKEARFVGFMAIANDNVWKSVPAGSINYASVMINETFGNPDASYKGVYLSEDKEDILKIYTFVSGLGLPQARIEGLKKDVSVQQAKIKIKDEDRMKNLSLDTGKDTAISDVDKIKERILAKTKGFGKLNNVIDRRTK
jgi:cell division GTPase FtsZ